MPGLKLKMDLTGKDSVFFTNASRYISGLSTLEVFRNPPEKVPSAEQARECLGRYKTFLEGAANGDRIQAAMRNQARKELTGMLKQILYYLQAVAEEDDLPALMQAGFEERRHVARKRAVVAPAGG